MDGYVSKPIRTSQLIAVIESILSAKTRLPPMSLREPRIPVLVPQS